jgi:multidrug transporter EmrE-like cation transporter
MTYYILMILYFLFNSCGLILMKLGSNNIGLSATKETFSLLLSWKFLGGFLCYICSFLLFSYLLTKSKLSYIYPLSAAVCYVLVILFSYLFLKEQISLLQFIGLALILSGVVLVNMVK